MRRPIQINLDTPSVSSDHYKILQGMRGAGKFPRLLKGPALFLPDNTRSGSLRLFRIRTGERDFARRRSFRGRRRKERPGFNYFSFLLCRVWGFVFFSPEGDEFRSDEVENVVSFRVVLVSLGSVCGIFRRFFQEEMRGFEK